MTFTTDGASGVSVGGQAMSKAKVQAAAEGTHLYRFEARDAQGNLLWVVEEKNIIPDEGCNDILQQYYKGSAYTAEHFVGLISGTPTVEAGDTMDTHAGWTEVTAYDEADRQALTLGTVAAKSVDNSASKAVFTIDTNGTAIGGGLLSTSNTRGGTTGVLVSAVAFTGGNKELGVGDTLSVTVTATMASA